MQKCSNCGQQNRPGVIFCENCGASLIGKLPLSTKALDSTESERVELGTDASILTEVRVQGTATFEHGMGLRLDVEGSPDPMHFTPRPETIFGRRDPATGDKPDIDLTPYAGYRMGVSRRHAAIRPGDESGLDLWDLGSSNGTFLNGQRLSAHRPYRLRDGDEIRLGQMVIRLHFEPESSRTPVPGPALALPEAPPAEAPAPASGAERPTKPVPPRPALEPAPAEAPAVPPSEKTAAEPAAPSAEKPAAEPVAPSAAKPAESSAAPVLPPAEKPAPAVAPPAAPAVPEKPVTPIPEAPAASAPAASKPAAAPALPDTPPAAPPAEPTAEPTAAPVSAEPPVPAEPPRPPVEPSKPDDEKSG